MPSSRGREVADVRVHLTVEEHAPVATAHACRTFAGGFHDLDRQRIRGRDDRDRRDDGHRRVGTHEQLVEPVVDTEARRASRLRRTRRTGSPARTPHVGRVGEVEVEQVRLHVEDELVPVSSSSAASGSVVAVVVTANVPPGSVDALVEPGVACLDSLSHAASTVSIVAAPHSVCRKCRRRHAEPRCVRVGVVEQAPHRLGDDGRRAGTGDIRRSSGARGRTCAECTAQICTVGSARRDAQDLIGAVAVRRGDVQAAVGALDGRAQPTEATSALPPATRLRFPARSVPGCAGVAPARFATAMRPSQSRHCEPTRNVIPDVAIVDAPLRPDRGRRARRVIGTDSL